LLVWPISDGAFDPVLWSGLVGPGFERASPAEIVWQVLGGDAVETAEPLLEAAVVGVDVVDVQVGRLRGRFSRRGHGMKRYFGFAGEGGDRPASVADQVVFACDNASQRRADRSAVGLRQDGVESRPHPVAGHQNGNVVLIGSRTPGRPAALARLARQSGPPALAGFEDEGLVRLDDSGQRSGLVGR